MYQGIDYPMYPGSEYPMHQPTRIIYFSKTSYFRENKMLHVSYINICCMHYTLIYTACCMIHPYYLLYQIPLFVPYITSTVSCIPQYIIIYASYLLCDMPYLCASYLLYPILLSSCIISTVSHTPIFMHHIYCITYSYLHA